MRDRYSIIVGLLFLAVIGIAAINTLGGGGGGEATLGLDRMPARWPLPEFAVPVAAGSLEGDANVAQDDCQSSSIPCPHGDRRPPACRIPTAGAIRVCDLFDKPLAVSFWFTKPSGCLPTQDAFDAVASQYRGRVNFLSIDIHSDREEVAGIIRDRGWTVPVGLDPDGAVSNLYRVGLCPTIVLAYPGGIVDEAKIEPGNYDEADISGFVDELIADSKARAAESR